MKKIAIFDQYLSSLCVVNGATVRCCKQSAAADRGKLATLIPGICVQQLSEVHLSTCIYDHLLPSSAECSRDKPPAYSENRIRQCGTSSRWSHRKHTDQCLQVAISFCRHRSVPVPCESDSVETTVAEEGCRIVGSHTRWELTTGADFQFRLHRLLTSVALR